MVRNVIIAAIFLPLAACASTGTKVSQETLGHFTSGVSTCTEVKQALGSPNIIKQSGEKAADTVWIYAYSATQPHPENFIPVIGDFAGGFDREATAAAFRFNSACVLDGTRYASANMGSGVNLEAVAQSRKDTGEALPE